MDISKIDQIAINNAKRLRRFSSLDQMLDLNALDIIEFNSSKVIFHTKKYPSEDRYSIIASYLELTLQIIARNTSPAISCDGFYYICVWDEHPLEMDFVLNFSNLPDLYQMNNYSGQLSLLDSFEFEGKLDRMVFIGASTGAQQVSENQRLRICHWGLQNKDISDFYISNYIQDDTSALSNTFGDQFRLFLNGFIPKEDQLHYKFIINVDGNVASWDRLVWIMNSNSLAFKFPSPEKNFLWYYPLLVADQHYVEVNLDNLRQKYQYYLSNPGEAKKIIGNAQSFVKSYLVPDAHFYYSSIMLSNVEVAAT